MRDNIPSNFSFVPVSTSLLLILEDMLGGDFMRLRLLILLLVVLPVAAQIKGTPSPENLYAKSKASVVTILTFDANKAPLGQGSGFIVAKNRVVTNYHVLAGSTSASIVFNDGSMAIVTSVISASEPKDLVIAEAETGKRS